MGSSPQEAALQRLQPNVKASRIGPGQIQNAGNKAVSRLVATSKTGAGSIQRKADAQSLVEKGWEFVKETLGSDDTPAEELVSEVNDGLESCTKLLERAAVVVSDKEAAERLEKAAGAFGGISGKIGTYLKVRKRTRNIVKFLAAVEEARGVDLAKDPQKGAEVMGRLFSSAGALGEDLTPDGLGALGAYFTLLKESEHFFSQMYEKLKPSEQRWVEGAQDGKKKKYLEGQGYIEEASPEVLPEDPGSARAAESLRSHHASEAALAAEMTIDRIGTDVDQRIAAGLEEVKPSLRATTQSELKRPYEEFRTHYDELMAMWTKYQEMGTVGRLWNRSEAQSLEKAIDTKAIQVSIALDNLNLPFLHAGVPVSFDPHKQTIDRFRKKV